MTRTFDILLKFPFGDLWRVPCLTNVYCALLYIRHMVPGDFIYLVEVLNQRFMRVPLYD
jgi:hypothetical protein